ncbi:MAG TPA: glycosyltransferase, partial [Segetibacter sp.]
NVLSVGRLTYQKGFDMLLKAWKNIFDNNTDIVELKEWKLIIVGGGEDEIKLKSLCKQLQLENSVTFVKPTIKIETFFRDATIFVMTSRFEGLPLALVEAKAFGLPTISFDCETGPREVITNEEDGLLIQANDTIAMSQAIVRLITEPEVRKKFSMKSVQKAKNYELQHIAALWDGLLKSI